VPIAYEPGLVPELVRMGMEKRNSDYLVHSSSLLFETFGAATWIKPNNLKILTALTLLFCYINSINQ